MWLSQGEDLQRQGERCVGEGFEEAARVGEREEVYGHAVPPTVRATWPAWPPPDRFSLSHACISSRRFPRPSGGTASFALVGKASPSRLAVEVDLRDMGPSLAFALT